MEGVSHEFCKTVCFRCADERDDNISRHFDFHVYLYGGMMIRTADFSIILKAEI